MVSEPRGWVFIVGAVYSKKIDGVDAGSRRKINRNFLGRAASKPEKELSMRNLLVVVAMLSLVVSNVSARSPKKLDQLMKDARTNPSPDLLAAIDREAAQKDAYRSGLFWYTDLSEAITAAKAANKPILSLRLLGRLDEEMSCANSRFFRKTLYVDPGVTKVLKERYILHWESVRPVPIVTIDYGNGTTVKRTLTGNSIHYLLAPDGQVLDGLPGLIDAATFERETTVFADMIARSDAEKAALPRYYEATLKRLADMPAAPPPALAADKAMAKTVGKGFVERPVLAAVRNPSLYVKEDTLRNQKELRPQLIAWLQAKPSPDLKAFNDRVYAELFSTPLNDPLMGLALPDEAAIAPGAPALAPTAYGPTAFTLAPATAR
jgi:hypothetical protein